MPRSLALSSPRKAIFSTPPNVADRQNNRIQVFDQDGTFVAEWKQFGQPSSVYVDNRDNIYVGATYQDASQGQLVVGPTTGANDRAIVIGNAITGELKHVIPPGCPPRGDVRRLQVRPQPNRRGIVWHL